MGDPLSIAASAAGIVSLGLQVCSGLLDYYQTWKNQSSDVSQMCQSLTALTKTFELLDGKVRNPLLDSESVNLVTESIVSCAAGVQRLQSKLDKIQKVKPGMRARFQRAQYPFKQKLLSKLLRIISDLRGNLSLATSTLDLDVSITTLQQLNQVNKDIKKLNDDSEVSSSKILETISKVHLRQEQENSRALSTEERDLMKWLSPLEFFSKQNDALSRRQEGTGQWLLESIEFRSWLNTAKRVLWCPGIPGAGKTIIASTVIDHLEREHRRGKTGVAYVYCVHNGVAQTASNFLGSLLRQLAMQSAASLKDIKSCYEHHARYGTRPSLKEIVGLLRSQVETFDQLFIIIDALDECPEQDQTRKSFFAQVRALPPKARLMVTSRNVPTIEKMFKHDMCIEIRAQDQDIKRFINSQIEQRDEFADLLEDHEELRFDITATVLEKANGMFLIAALHMDSLAKEDNIRELKESLQSLPKDLDKTYDNALERIRQQEPRKLARADQVLRLISCARRPLKLEEMRQILSIRMGDTYVDPEAVPKSESVISTCCGLVVVESDSQIVRLVHYTTGEYFQRKLQSYRSPEAHGYIAGVLITYLSFTTFTTFSLMNLLQDATDEAAARDPDFALSWSEERTVVENYIEGFLERNALLQYAAVNWGHHVREAFTNIRDACSLTHDSDNNEVNSVRILVRLTQDFLGKENNMDCANEVFHHVEKQFDSIGLGNEFLAPMDLTSLHVTASFGILYLVGYYLDQGVEIDAKDSEGMTALHKAAKYGHENVVRLLLTSGAAIGIRDQWEQNALVWAVGANEVSVSRVLLQNAIDPGFQDSRKSPMCIAASRGYEEIVELLAESHTDIVRKKDLLRKTLLDAALCGRDGIVRLLVRGGKNWNISKQCLARAMTQAASRGHVTTMEILLDAGVDVKSPLSYGRESLREVATCGHSEATQLLLAAGADPNLKPEGDDFPLHAAARNGHVATVNLLLDEGADVDALSSKGETALVVIAGPKYGFLARAESLPENSVFVMRQLLEKGANVNAVEPRSNRTPLEYAIMRGHEGLVQLLLQYVSFDASRKDTMLYLTRLYHAIRFSNTEGIVDRLLCEKGAQGLRSVSKLLLMSIPAERGHERAVVTFLESGAAIEAEDHLMGHTALQVSAMSGKIAIVRRLLQEGANINSRGSADSTPLMMAAQHGRTDVVEFLLNEGAGIDAIPVNEDSSRTALAQALDRKHTATARVLLERGAYANALYNQSSGERLIHTVAKQSGWGQIPNLALLLEKGADLEAKTIDGQTPLVLGIQAENAETVKHLLEQGADLESRDTNGQTPLIVAVQRHGLETLTLLLDSGALLEARDRHGQTALMVAARKSGPSTLQLLLERGADLEARDADDHTPLVVAVRSGIVNNVEFLLERGGNPVSLPPGVTVADDEVNKWDFDRGVKLVLDAKGVWDAGFGRE